MNIYINLINLILCCIYISSKRTAACLSTSSDDNGREGESLTTFEKGNTSTIDEKPGHSRWYVTQEVTIEKRAQLTINSRLAKDDAMSNTYDKLCKERELVQSHITKIKDLQSEFDFNYIFAGFSLHLVPMTQNLVDLCFCKNNSLNDDCVACNIPTSVMTSISAPDRIEKCGDSYAVMHFGSELIQLCSKNGKRMNFFWCTAASIVWHCSVLISYKTASSDLFLGASHLVIPLGKKMFVKYFSNDKSVEIFDRYGNSIYFENLDNFEKFYDICANFPNLSKESLLPTKTFTPCSFIAIDGCIYCKE